MEITRKQVQSRRHFLFQLPVGFSALALTLHAPKLRAESAMTIPATALMEPRAAAEMQKRPGAAQWKILQVGFHSMYDQKHIPGALYAGPGSQPEGVELLKRTVAGLPRTTQILLYCGCCPWLHCPNIAPAWDALQSMHFTAVKVLRIADNFGDNWVAQGYPVA